MGKKIPIAPDTEFWTQTFNNIFYYENDNLQTIQYKTLHNSLHETKNVLKWDLHQNLSILLATHSWHIYSRHLELHSH